MKDTEIVKAPIRLVDLLDQQYPEFVEIVSSYESALVPVARELAVLDVHPAFKMVGAVELNDFNDLLFDCASGRGRSAMRCARVVFEHLLNLEALVDDELCDRFIRHTLVGVDAAAAHNPIERYVEGKNLKAMRHRMKVLGRDNKAELAQAIEEYGASYKRQWLPGSLRDRAVAVGLEAEYDFFRTTSAAVHGSASSSEGSFWVVDGEPAIRIGPTTVTGPPSLAAGIRFHRAFLVAMGDRLSLNVSDLVSAVDALSAEVWPFCTYTNWLEGFLFAQDGLDRPSVAAVQLDLRRHND